MKRVVCYQDEAGVLHPTGEPPGCEPGQVYGPLIRIGAPGECWTWIGKINNNGYGNKRFNGRSMLAHRWIWEQLFGPVPAGLVVSHACHNRACVNPHHLRVCTQADNVRGGEAAKLTIGDVVEIRHLYDNGWTGPQLAERFGVSQHTVYDIGRRKSWRKAVPFYAPKRAA